eukprot:CAMPEP_0116847314 /NCGR_PEP_ID=MMETSP0418-20121206/14365_1 /TAXON_ID=1158023 /ORGANISM="Astrosyne radiata, Strain 13vi08-1A" /LENGTH=213 /DNA_ID=CAMNT_0004478745 /DNA_START=276 /DNA_END=917 /DNA_ORIENTATION=+
MAAVTEEKEKNETASACRARNLASLVLYPSTSHVTSLRIRDHADTPFPMSTANNNDSSVQSLDEVFPCIPYRYYKVATGSKGRGLFAIRDIPPRTLLHIAPCIIIQAHEYQNHLRHSILEDYLFNGGGGGNKLMALGDGSLFNHANRPNVDYRIHCMLDECVIRFTSGHAVIEKGEELCISYGSHLWFENVEGQQEEEDDDKDGVDFLNRMEL